MQVIVTGFDPFGGFEANPSQEAVLKVGEAVKIDEGEVVVTAAVLPTCCAAGWETLDRVVSGVLEAHPNEPFAVIMTGLAGTRDVICLERFAVNARRYAVADNGGHQGEADFIDQSAPDARRTGVRLFDLRDRLQQAGYACDVSNHAGAFVCNETYFKALGAWREHKACWGVLFVHLPPYSAYAEYMGNTKPGWQGTAGPDLYAAAIEEIVRFVYNYPDRREIAS